MMKRWVSIIVGALAIGGVLSAQSTPTPILPETVALFLAVLLLGSGAYLLRGQRWGAVPHA